MISPLRAALRTRLTAAMRAGDKPTVGVLRSTLAALENAEAVPVQETGGVAGSEHLTGSEHVAGAAVGVGAAESSRRTLTAEQEHAVVRREAAELRASAAALVEAGAQQRADELVRMAEVLDAVAREPPGCR